VRKRTSVNTLISEEAPASGRSHVPGLRSSRSGASAPATGWSPFQLAEGFYKNVQFLKGMPTDRMLAMMIADVRSAGAFFPLT